MLTVQYLDRFCKLLNYNYILKGEVANKELSEKRKAKSKGAKLAADKRNKRKLLMSFREFIEQ